MRERRKARSWRAFQGCDYSGPGYQLSVPTSVPATVLIETGPGNVHRRVISQIDLAEPAR